MTSLIDNLKELECDMAVITETWLADGESLQEDIQDIKDGVGYSMLVKNRARNRRGVAHGGVAVLTRDTMITAKPFKFHNQDGHEVVAVE